MEAVSEEATEVVMEVVSEAASEAVSAVVTGVVTEVVTEVVTGVVTEAATGVVTEAIAIVWVSEAVGVAVMGVLACQIWEAAEGMGAATAATGSATATRTRWEPATAADPTTRESEHHRRSSWSQLSHSILFRT